MRQNFFLKLLSIENLLKKNTNIHYMVADVSEYKLNVAGFGDTPKAALEDAEARLPFEVSEIENYCTKYAVSDPREVEGGQVKVEIGYNPKKASKTKKTKSKSSTHGSTDPFAVTRNLESRV
jgi:hypothetical protein